MAELTSDQIKHEGPKFIADFVFRLSHVYGRPEASIMLTVQPDTLMIFGSHRTLPVYLLTIYALPSLIAPVTNLRNTNLIQDALNELLGIPPSLGVVIFLSIPEDNFATNKATIRDEIQRLERNDEMSPGLFKTISHTMSRRLKSNSGSSAPFSLPSTASALSPSTNPGSGSLQSPVVANAADLLIGEDRGRSLRKRDSLRALMRRHLKDKLKDKDSKENDGRGQ